MAIVATASEVQKNFGLYHDKALSEPVTISKYGRITVALISAADYELLNRVKKQAVPVAELTDAELAEIAAAEIPAERRYSIDQLE
ncbi:MAG TPA: type II toxin-antitoxin system prevent-host-death family antitoxin [Alphaproteobacteria bacterium]|nr:type II toxin-antitoxin system prevent-host-death family antitoxin [Alphaproteobacteria bacterium]